ncbi:hypothetical protein AAF712_007055 [Marasmius tenuissimus]|uniref:Uncharacterized protein n=1 Tax=Marasmius tenuissimus TaxID=585030 RepID=A0ABR2ZXP6_9AGAR
MLTAPFRDFLTSVIRSSVSNSTVLSHRDAFVSSTGPCNDINECRTLEDIVSSCYWVIIVSIWASLHPNVPDVLYVDSTTAIGCLLNDVATMSIAIMAPELVMLWAMRQTYTAGRVAQRFKGYGWTKAHGFLSIMKGIALYDGEKFLCYLQYSEKAPNKKERELIEMIDKRLQQTTQDQETRIRGTGNMDSNTTQSPRDSSSQIAGPEASPTADEVLASPTERHFTSTAPGVLRQREQVPSGDEPSGSVNNVDPKAVDDDDDDGGVQSSGYKTRNLRSSRDRESLPHSAIEFGPQPPSPSGNFPREPGQPLPLSLLERLIQRRLVEIPEQAIKDTLNHGDYFSKGIAILQTSWFVSKMMSRLINKLYITELEVVAFTSVFLGLVAHVCWWYKPQRVRHPYRVQLPKPRLPLSYPLPTTAARLPAPSPSSCRSQCWGWVCSAARSFRVHSRSEASAFWRRVCRDYHGTRKVNKQVHSTVFHTAYPIYLLATLVGALLNADSYDDTNRNTIEEGGKDTVYDYPFFCGVDVDTTPTGIYFALYFISVMVGLIHLGSWPSKTPPEEHPDWWRFGAIVLTVLPVIFGFAHYLRSRERSGGDAGARRSLAYDSAFYWVSMMSFNLSVWLFLAARWGLIFLALAELYQLPPESDAFHDVNFGVGFHIG